MGDTWFRKRSSDLRLYHKNYQRETWGKLLHCLTHEGLNVNGKVVKPVLKERFKSFNAMFDEIHRAQSTWVVSDEQLQSELRVSISAVVIPAYRSFMARFSQTFTPGRQTEKYIKYQPEDMETYIDELFDGSATPTGRTETMTNHHGTLQLQRIYPSVSNGTNNIPTLFRKTSRTNPQISSIYEEIEHTSPTITALFLMR
ncbi:hypothetical protein F0562_004476 [Nyssa sinensis]|uniref:Exocyst subunit Exo70 family protein n=1 Tax=Nyssa sinensis TaxID=561372 RepID=A0A5J5BYJ4_9ASTE|nr:hypothetical protein F0562_004476 [Nyssa sinensis]